MAKEIEFKLDALTCELGGPAGILDFTGVFDVQGWDDPNNVVKQEIIFDFPGGPLRLAKGETVAIGRDARIALATPAVDPPGLGVMFVKFGCGELLVTDAGDPRPVMLESVYQELASREIVSDRPVEWHLYIGRNTRIFRADFTVRFVHHL